MPSVTGSYTGWLAGWQMNAGKFQLLKSVTDGILKVTALL